MRLRHVIRQSVAALHRGEGWLRRARELIIGEGADSL